MNQNENQETTPETQESPSTSAAASEESHWVARFEELLKVKNFAELKSELQKIAADVQTEIQSFDLNAHLSPTAKARLKKLEQRYNDVMKLVARAQKQFDREFNKSLRVLKKTRQDAEKHLHDIRSKIVKHRGSLMQASRKFSAKWKRKKSPAKKSRVVKK